MTRRRSTIHMLTVAAARLEQDNANPTLIAGLRDTAQQIAKRHAEGRTWSPAEDKRVDAQRTLFNMVPNGPAKAALLNAMLQRAYDLMWDGDCSGCDALTEFLPSIEAGQMFDAWESDTDPKTEKRSHWYDRAGEQAQP